jgi:hypothetical protein
MLILELAVTSSCTVEGHKNVVLLIPKNVILLRFSDIIANNITI